MIEDVKPGETVLLGEHDGPRMTVLEGTADSIRVAWFLADGTMDESCVPLAALRRPAPVVQPEDPRIVGLMRQVVEQIQVVEQQAEKLRLYEAERDRAVKMAMKQYPGLVREELTTDQAMHFVLHAAERMRVEANGQLEDMRKRLKDAGLD